MITIFNRKELWVTDNMAEQARIRDVLAAAGIDYECKIANRGGASVTRTWADSTRQFQYYFYVQKKDYDEALYVIRKN